MRRKAAGEPQAAAEYIMSGGPCSRLRYDFVSNCFAILEVEQVDPDVSIVSSIAIVLSCREWRLRNNAAENTIV